jgi:hypothetical protein
MLKLQSSTKQTKNNRMVYQRILKFDFENRTNIVFFWESFADTVDSYFSTLPERAFNRRPFRLDGCLAWW